MTLQSEVVSRRILVPVVAATVGVAVLIVLFAAWGPDWPAAEFRVWQARHSGLDAIWSNAWFSGDSTVSYSVLYPYLGFAFTAGGTGVLAAGFISWGAATLAPLTSRTIALGFVSSVGVVVLAALLVGQVPFLAGVAAGVWAVRATVSHRPFSATALAAICSLISPIAGLFVLVCIPAAGVALGRARLALPLLGATAGLIMTGLFGGIGGDYPFTIAILIETVTFCLVVVALARNRALQVFAVTYLVVTLGLGLVGNPVGGNDGRLGGLVALPLAWLIWSDMRAHLGARARALVVVVLMVTGGMWQVDLAITAAVRGAADPSQNPSYYAGIVGFLHTQDPRTGRLEVVLTREHWESDWLARVFPLARGWERQADLRVSSVLYHPLTAATYRRWLDDNAVDLVALPSVPIDAGGAAEAMLLRDPPPYLRLVYHDADWRVWAVRHARPLVTGPASMTALGMSSFTLRFHRSGDAIVRLHGTDLWQVSGGDACLATTRGGWTSVDARVPGEVTVRAGLSWDAALGRPTAPCERHPGQ